MKSHTISNQRGSGLIMGIVLMGAIMISFLALSSVMDQQRKSQKMSNAKLSATMVRYNLMVHLANAFACLKNIPVNCLTIDEENFIPFQMLLDATGSLVIDGSTGKGLDSIGNICPKAKKLRTDPWTPCHFNRLVTECTGSSFMAKNQTTDS